MARPRRGRGKGRPSQPAPPVDEAAAAPPIPPPPVPPPPPEPLPPEEAEPERSPDRERPAAAAWRRGLQRSLGRLLPGWAAGAMKRGGGGGGGGCARKSAAGDGHKPRSPDRLVLDWHAWLSDAVKSTGVYIISADNKIWLTLLMAAVSGILHWYHITTLFENNSHFSHLSALEREMFFRTEMGLYYSYFKTIVEAPSFLEGLLMIMNDRITEYPLVINTLKRFNLYPEVVLAYWYRMYTGIMNVIGIPTKNCWIVNRGEGVSPVESCEGLGDPASFYVAVIFLLNGLLVSVFFIYGAYLRFQINSYHVESISPFPLAKLSELDRRTYISRD